MHANAQYVLAPQHRRGFNAIRHARFLGAHSSGTHTMNEQTTEKEQEASSSFSFEDMRLAVGDRLQIECSASTGMQRAFVRVLGYLEGISLMVTAPAAGRNRIALIENDLVIVRAFSRQSAFAFRASVLRACKLPFDYLHLSFPTKAQGTLIRKAMRVRTSIPAQVGKGDGGEMAQGTLLNLSATGALIHSLVPLGEEGGLVRLRFETKLHDVESVIDVAADIRNVQEGAAEGEDDVEYQYGVDFRDLSPTDRMQIKSLVYQIVIEHPRQVI